MNEVNGGACALSPMQWIPGPVFRPSVKIEKTRPGNEARCDHNPACIIKQLMVTVRVGLLSQSRSLSQGFGCGSVDLTSDEVK